MGNIADSVPSISSSLKETYLYYTKWTNVKKKKNSSPKKKFKSSNNENHGRFRIDTQIFMSKNYGIAIISNEK